jgi:hypothetical protein
MTDESSSPEQFPDFEAQVEQALEEASLNLEQEYILEIERLKYQKSQLEQKIEQRSYSELPNIRLARAGGYLAVGASLGAALNSLEGSGAMYWAEGYSLLFGMLMAYGAASHSLWKDFKNYKRKN